MAGMGCDRWRSFTQPEHLCNGARKAPWGFDGLGVDTTPPEAIRVRDIIDPVREEFRLYRQQELEAEQASRVAKQQGRLELAKIEAESRSAAAQARVAEAALAAGRPAPIIAGKPMPTWALPALGIGAGLLLLMTFMGKKRR